MMSARPELTGLTVLRLLAALFVLLFHSRYFSEGSLLEIPIYALFSSGWLGVDIFFVLSGFVISYVYSNQLRFGRYLLRRFARIYPAYLISTLAALLISLVLGKPTFASYEGIDVLMNLLMLQGWYGDWRVSVNFVSWSVSAEWAAYLLFPALIWAARLIPLNWLGVILPLVLFVVWTGSGWVGAASPVTKCIFEFTSGIMLFRIWAKRGSFGPSIKPIALLSFSAMLVLPAWSGRHGFTVENTYLAFFAVPVVTWATTWRIRNRLLLFGGRASYSIYLVHGVVYMFLRRMIELGHLERGVGLPLFLFLSLGIAAFSYVWLEKPARSWIISWSSKLQAPTSA